MKAIHTPKLGAVYWALLCIASVTGANFGDFVSHNLGGGHWRGLLPEALVFAVILWAARRSARPTGLFYWLAILTVRTAATNLADLVTHDARVPYPLAVAGLAILLVATVAIAVRKPPSCALPAPDAAYWLAMLLAGTLGTAAGDATAGYLGLGVALGTAALAVLTALCFAVRSRPALAIGWSYWLSVVAVRAAGTTAGDWSGDTLGLEWSTLGWAVLFAVGFLAVDRARAEAPVAA